MQIMVVQVSAAEQFLDSADVVSGLNRMCRERVTQHKGRFVQLRQQRLRLFDVPTNFVVLVWRLLLA